MEGERKMAYAKRRDVVLAVTTETGPLLAFRFRERTFGYLAELLEHLKTVGFPDGEALEAP